MNDILKRITFLMKQKGMTDYQLCQTININPSTFATWKKEDRVPNTVRLSGIAKALDVSLDYIVNGREYDGDEHYIDDEAAQIAQELLERPELKVLFDSSRKVKPKDLKIVQQMVDRMVEDDK